MSKKKATMTLKDFHGGSIPSDLRLPSAPGVTVRPDRPGFDRQMSWGNSVGRADHRIRPASAGSARNLDENTPFLSHSSHIGRNFDEDERKPLDGVSGPRRTIGDESVHAQPTRLVEPKIDNLSGARVGSRVASISLPQTSSSSTVSSYAGRVSEVHNARLNNQTSSGSRSYGSNYPIMGGNAGQAVAGSYPNAWGIRKETASMKEPVSAAWSAPDAETKLAHASALEKVSSGRWNSKQHVHSPKDAEVLGHPETEGEFGYNTNNTYNKKTYNRPEVVGDPGYHDVALMMHAERSLAVGDGIHGGGKEMPTYERSRSNIRMESYERNTSVTANGFQSLRHTGKSGGSEFQPILPSESSDRPKLKLLPRSKPLENVESPTDHKQLYEQTSDHLRVEDSYAVHESKNPIQSGFAGPVVADRAPERPKLNLKPRSQALEQLEGNTEPKRVVYGRLDLELKPICNYSFISLAHGGATRDDIKTVFGGARPRELVLRERGIEDDVSSYESQPPLSYPQRVKETTPKADTFMHATPARFAEKAEINTTDQRIIAKHSDRRDHPLDVERPDSHRRNRPNEIWRNNRDVEKHRGNQQQKQQVQDRAPSPETWRKPVEQSKPASPDAPPVRYGKAASAVELAQAFSKSVSDPNVADRFSGSRGVPSRSQMPFSRLMGPTPRPQINGY
ncbi:hypothetical protein DH2020_017337 [Rehmannia glutinosa]|uniref:Uncharacterized protein n=1 Tax=Rehmannia glutinosa TaxID=99300 RepID=A0ABR0WQU1_REHGL